jgi:hypothetical protein
MTSSTSYLKRIKFYAPLILLFFCFTTVGNAQKSNSKFGEAVLSELKKKNSSIEPEADAEYLLNNCWTKLSYEPGLGWRRKMIIHKKIKIYSKEDASDWANVIFSLYGKDTYSGLKVVTHNLVDGKSVSEQISKKDIFRENVTEEKENVRFTFPNVKDGSVLEWKYELMSENIFSLGTWYFQYSIPVVHSSYKVSIPSYFNYQSRLIGFDKPSDKVVDYGSDVIYFGTIKSSIDTRSIKIIYKDVEALKREQFVFNINNYRNSIRFELESYKEPNKDQQDFTSTWASIAVILMKDKELGLQLRRKAFLKDFFLEMNPELKGKSDKDKMRILFDYVRTNIKWNNNRSKYVDEGIKKAFEDRIGNSAEINLLLINMLRKAGLEANPLVLSTTDNGAIINECPSILQLNYLITAVEMDGKTYLMDAAHKYSNINALPFYCLNYTGFVLYEKGFKEVDLSSKSVERIKIISKVDADGLLSGSFQKMEFGHATIEDRSQLESDEDELVEVIKEMHEGIVKDSFEFVNKTNVKQPLLTNYTFEDETNIQKIGDRLFINPLLYIGQDENPFKKEGRKFPVEIGSSIQENYNISLELPEGYTVEYLPQAIKLELPDNLGSYYFAVSEGDTSINAIRKLSLNRPIYSAAEAAGLRALFLRIVEVEAEKIILAKVE